MKRILSLLMSLIVLLSSASCTIFAEYDYKISGVRAKLIVHFINVGQGDCILLESGDEFVLIDAGEFDSGDRILQYITERGAKTLKYVIATHPHSDHIGGMRTVLNGIDALNFITVETDDTTYMWTKLLKTVDENDINYIDAEAGDTYTFGEATFTTMAPLSSGYDNDNNYSVVTKVECGDISFMLTGDAEKESEYEMVEEGDDLSADVLKCGHHGSSNSTTSKFLKEVNPAYAVISCGKDNEYGHPSKDTLQKLNILGCEVLRTDELGTIAAYTDGMTLCFKASDAELSTAPYTAGQQKNYPDALNYIGNVKSHKFHYATCSGAASMNEKNKVIFTSREDAVKEGYKPCGTCDP